VVYFRSFFDRLAFDRAAVSDADVAHYAAAYATTTQLRTGFEFYRQSYDGIERLSAARAAPAGTPIILVGGEHSLGAVNGRIADSLRARGWRSVGQRYSMKQTLRMELRQVRHASRPI
jgi:hypothetical protein